MIAHFTLTLTLPHRGGGNQKGKPQNEALSLDGRGLGEGECLHGATP